jgi:actin-related protein
LACPRPELLALFDTGRTTGLVVDCGHQISIATAIHDGYCCGDTSRERKVPDAVSRIAGEAVTAQLDALLAAHGFSFVSGAERASFLQQVLMKERHGRVVTTDFRQALAEDRRLVGTRMDVEPLEDRAYELPDGSIVNMLSMGIECAEVLFNPSLHLGSALSRSQTSLPDLVVRTVYQCPDASLRSELLRNVVLCGGSSMFPGLPERLELELSGVGPVPALVNARPNREYAVWTGGSIVASLDSSASMWASKAEYDEEGPSVLARKALA